MQVPSENQKYDFELVVALLAYFSINLTCLGMIPVIDFFACIYLFAQVGPCTISLSVLVLQLVIRPRLWSGPAVVGALVAMAAAVGLNYQFAFMAMADV